MCFLFLVDNVLVQGKLRTSRASSFSLVMMSRSMPLGGPGLLDLCFVFSKKGGWEQTGDNVLYVFFLCVFVGVSLFNPLVQL